MFWRILKTGGIGRHYYTFEIDAWAMTPDYNAKFLCCGNDELFLREDVCWIAQERERVVEKMEKFIKVLTCNANLIGRVETHSESNYSEM